MDLNKKKTSIKVCIIGDSGVGKTSLIMRYIKDEFSDQYRITVGADLFSNDITLDDKQYVLQVWDTAGQEKFRSIGSAFYRGSDACVLVYDVTSEKSFQSLDNWRQEFVKQGGISTDKDFPFIILGSKCDRTDDREVDLSKAQEYCQQNKMAHFETSAKENIGIMDAFQEIVKQAVKQHQEDDFYIPPQIALKPNQPKKNNGNGGCC